MIFYKVEQSNIAVETFNRILFVESVNLETDNNQNYGGKKTETVGVDL